MVFCAHHGVRGDEGGWCGDASVVVVVVGSVFRSSGGCGRPHKVEKGHKSFLEDKGRGGGKKNNQKGHHPTQGIRREAWNRKRRTSTWLQPSPCWLAFVLRGEGFFCKEMPSLLCGRLCCRVALMVDERTSKAKRSHGIDFCQKPQTAQRVRAVVL